jgi:hypothetical protein
VGKFDVDLLQPDNETENWIRKKCGMPLKSKTSRPRWAPIQTRLQEQEEGEFPAEPGTKPQEEGGKPPGVSRQSSAVSRQPSAVSGQRSAASEGGAQLSEGPGEGSGPANYDREAHADDRPKDECGIVSGE